MDWDEDGNQDLIVGENNGKVRYFRNVGSATNPVLTFEGYLQANGVDIDCGSYSTPCVNDWDEDGAKDLLIGDTTGQFFLFINQGTNSNPVFTGYSILRLSNNTAADVGYRSGPNVVDLNNDGLKDLVSGAMDQKTYFFENTGSNANPVFTAMTPLQTGSLTMMSLSSTNRVTTLDWNDDGNLDLISGCYDTRLQLFLQGTASVPGANVTMQTIGGYIIPAGGGNFRYSVTVQNPSTTAATNFDFWTEVLLPNDTYYGPILLRYDIELNPSTSLQRNLQLQIPPGAPQGYYYYYGYSGDYENEQIYCSDYVYIFKTATDGGDIYSGWSDGEAFGETAMNAPIPEVFALHSPYPNPFNPTTTISFTLGETSYASLAVYNIQGKLVEILTEGILQAGVHERVFAAHDLTSGVYFVRLEAGGQVMTQKVVLVK